MLVKFSTVLAATVLACGLSTSEKVAHAAAGDSASFGGQILEPGPDLKISFGGWATEPQAGVFEGELQINFHRINDATIADKSKFHGVSVTEIIFFDSDNDSCNAAIRATFTGTLNGDPGYTVVLRAGDAGSPGSGPNAEPFDTIRLTLTGPDSYETSDLVGGQFESQSNCVGSARTGLDRGNITIRYP